ncbi:MAG: C69 family dipeptidase [Nocardioidaceae bacterium]
MGYAWSCDTYVAQRDATASGRLLFGKNSDRPAGEAQPLRFVSRRDAAESLDLAYVSIPDEPSLAHIGAAPFWCWGYEFGLNENDVVIGNEAQFTRSWAEDVAAARRGNPPVEGIIGMELVRLGLERGHDARGALDVMTRLLERHGQWASGQFGSGPADGAYDNSYLIADRTDAWVLETSGREWVARQVGSGVCSISNEPSIRTEFDLSSTGLVDTAVSRDWVSPSTTFDYAASHADPQTPLQVSHIRQRRSHQLLNEAARDGGVDLSGAKRVLRDHYEGTFLEGPYFNAARPDFHTLCMHEHPSGFTWGNTAGSIIVDLASDDDDLTVLWWAPLTPCTGAYIPLFVAAAALPETLQVPTPSATARRPESVGQATFDPTSFWWRSQDLLDATKGDAYGATFEERQREVRSRLDRLERAWVTEVETLRATWKAATEQDRISLRVRLGELTERAVREVDAEVADLIAAFAPDRAARPIDPRWA